MKNSSNFRLSRAEVKFPYNTLQYIQIQITIIISKTVLIQNPF